MSTNSHDIGQQQAGINCVHGGVGGYIPMNSCNPPLTANESKEKLHLSKGMRVQIARIQVNSTGHHTVQVKGQKDMLTTSCNPPPMVNKSEEKLYTCQQVCEYK